MNPQASQSDQSAATEQSQWFALEVQQYESALRSWLRNKFPALIDVDDLVQESYARLFRARVSSRIRDPKSYLFSIAHNAAMDWFRGRQYVAMEPLDEEGTLPAGGDRPGVAEAMNVADELELLREAIRALPARCRKVMELQNLQGFSNQEIATALGISVNTVNAQVVIGLVRCRRYLRARGALR